MSFRMRRSIRIAPGVRMNFSKSGIGFLAGVKGYRITRQADGRTRRTVSLPGTGLSHVTTSGSSRAGATGSRSAAARRAGPTAPVAPPRAMKPGVFAPKGEKELHRALSRQDVEAIERVAQEHPEYAVAAATLAGLIKLGRGDLARAQTLLAWVFARGIDPATDPFIAKYVTARFTLAIVPGVTAELTADRGAVGLALAELYQGAGELDAAIDTVEQLEPTTYAALSLAELYCRTERWHDVVELTDGVTNTDDTTALLSTFRGVGLREQGFFDAAREAFKEALRSKQREPVVRHRALFERARCSEAEHKRAFARKDLERILAEDSTYPGLADALAALDE